MLHVFLPLLSFRHHLASFDSTFMHVFERFLSLGSLECQEALLVCQNVSLPISSGGIGFIYVKTIVPTTYFESWMLIVLIIAFKLLLDLHPFLLEVIEVTI